MEYVLILCVALWLSAFSVWFTYRLIAPRRPQNQYYARGSVMYIQHQLERSERKVYDYAKALMNCAAFAFGATLVIWFFVAA
jgi:hypothetical protein